MSIAHSVCTDQPAARIVLFTLATIVVVATGCQQLETQRVMVENTSPSSVPISGTVAVNNLPTNQLVSGSVSVSNFPGVQPVTGTITSNPIPFGISNSVVNISSLSSATASQSGSIGSHSVMVYVSVTMAVVPEGGVPAFAQLTLTGASSGPITYPIPISSIGNDGTAARYMGQSSSPIYIPADAGYTLTAGQLAGTPTSITGTFSLTGVNLN